MKIKKIHIWKENLELTRPYAIAYERIEAVENVFVLIEADNGFTGIGAASPSPEVTGETISHCQERLEQKLEPVLTGADLRRFNFLLRQLGNALVSAPAALAAADIALHDLAAKALGLPLVTLLGQVHEGLPTSVTIGILPLEKTLDEAEEFVGNGFNILKIKTGIDLDEDIERMVKLRETLDSRVMLRVDANQGYSPAQYQKFYNQTRNLNLEFVEQPLKASDISGMCSLSKEIRDWTAGDETILDPASAVSCLGNPRPFGIFNIKLMKCGGIAPAMEIATMAGHAGIDLMWGCNDESIISITAALHAALASPTTKYLDLDGSLDLARDVVDGGFLLRDGWLFPNEQPGLGVHRRA
ncbi:MAG TPA: dipeptide epimerase [Desulfotignum sp.]|nr:dipeptide epimerase [Desulfotignum sp.]